MRERIGHYRGKDAETGEWVYGYFVFHHPSQTAYIVDCEQYDQYGTLLWHTVDPATVGEFTGLQDQNGIDNYGGDIIEFSGNARIGEPNWIKVQEWDDSHGRFTVTATVQLNGGKPYIDGKRIGNIHDNPELLDSAEETRKEN